MISRTVSRLLWAVACAFLSGMLLTNALHSLWWQQRSSATFDLAFAGFLLMTSLAILFADWQKQ